ncbi:MAG TPA: hypothetical protein VFX18_05730 [Candidatus Nitrosocosmicus sp.]|nr:hypothetical protein [Candidatus Nitrosocosmicus sp.]
MDINVHNSMEELLKVKQEIPKELSIEDRIANIEAEITVIEKEIMSIYEILKELAGNK